MEISDVELGCAVPGEDLSQYLPEAEGAGGGGGVVAAGPGVYMLGGRPVASLAGLVHTSAQSTKEGEKLLICVIPCDSSASTNAVIETEDVVIARVTRVTANQALVDIVAVGDHTLQQYARGTIRREDVRTGGDVDALVMHECFRPGDLLRATVISLGDARQYFLSTAAPELGVVWARSRTTGNVMVPKGFKVRALLVYHIL